MGGGGGGMDTSTYICQEWILNNFVLYGNTKVSCNLSLQVSVLQHGKPVVTTKDFYCMEPEKV